MSISSISLTPSFQAAQNVLRLSQDLAPQTVQLKDQSPMMNFGDILASRLSEQPSAISQSLNIAAAQPSTFKGVLLQMIDSTQSLQRDAGQAVQKLVRGEGSLHSAMIAMEEASVSFQLLAEMRNKLVESLQEMMRMQI